MLINLIHVGRLRLLGDLPDLEFVVPDDVVEEVSRREARRDLEAGLEAVYLRRVSLTDPAALEVFADLRSFLGRGEAACLALAQCEGWLVASDEKRAFRNEALRRLGEGRLLTTAGLLLLAIRAELLSIEEADTAKAVLERRRFRMTFGSFADLL